MKYYFRGKVVAEFVENEFGRIDGKYTLNFPEARECHFIEDDIELFKDFFNEIDKVLDGRKEYKDLEDIEVY